jgi:hypothetical protein
MCLFICSLLKIYLILFLDMGINRDLKRERDARYRQKQRESNAEAYLQKRREIAIRRYNKKKANQTPREHRQEKRHRAEWQRQYRETKRVLAEVPVELSCPLPETQIAGDVPIVPLNIALTVKTRSSSSTPCSAVAGSYTQQHRSNITPRMAAALQREKKKRDIENSKLREENVKLKRVLWRMQKRQYRKEVGS